MGPIEAGNGIFQILMILCVHVGLVIGTTFRAKISPIDVFHGNGDYVKMYILGRNFISKVLDLRNV